MTVEADERRGNRSLWDQLTDETTPAGKMFMEHYTKLDDNLGNAIGQLSPQPQDIQGRDEEIALLHAILERPVTPVALLVGHAGVGKTALVEQFAKDLNANRLDTNVHNKYLLVALRLGVLASLGTSELQTRLATLLDDFYELEKTAQRALDDPDIKIVLFMDEVHMLVTIFGAGTKVGGDVVKDVLARAPIRVIAATTRREYDSTLAVDKPLSERFKQIEMNELSHEIVVQVIQDWWKKVAPDCPDLDRDVIEEIITANAKYRSDSAEPRKSLDIVEDLVSYCRRTGLPADKDVVHNVFNQRYSISLAFNIDSDTVYQRVAHRVKGQPYAKYMLRRALASMVFQLNPASGRPILTMLFTGPTGVGKTETAKAIASAVHPGQDVFYPIDMADYTDAGSKASFQKRVGEFARHTPNAVLLFDELEKAHSDVMDTLLAILDEGRVTFEVLNREGRYEVNEISLRDTIIVCTTNSGAGVFEDDAKYSQRGVRGDDIDGANVAEVRQLMQNIRAELTEKDKFRHEMLGRFNKIVPFRSLTNDALIQIAEAKMNDMIEAFRLRGITVEIDEPRAWPRDRYPHFTSDIVLYITYIKANAQDPNSGGARNIDREIRDTLEEPIIMLLLDRPDCKRVKIEVTKDTPIYSEGAIVTEGGVEIHAIED